MRLLDKRHETSDIQTLDFVTLRHLSAFVLKDKHGEKEAAQRALR